MLGIEWMSGNFDFGWPSQWLAGKSAHKSRRLLIHGAVFKPCTMNIVTNHWYSKRYDLVSCCLGLKLVCFRLT